MPVPAMPMAGGRGSHRPDLLAFVSHLELHRDVADAEGRHPRANAVEYPRMALQVGDDRMTTHRHDPVHHGHEQLKGMIWDGGHYVGSAVSGRGCENVIFLLLYRYEW